MTSSSDLSEKKASHPHIERIHSGDADVAARITAGREEVLDEEEGRRLRRKIDWHILPLMCCECFSSWLYEKLTICAVLYL